MDASTCKKNESRGEGERAQLYFAHRAEERVMALAPRSDRSAPGSAKTQRLGADCGW